MLYMVFKGPHHMLEAPGGPGVRGVRPCSPCPRAQGVREQEGEGKQRG